VKIQILDANYSEGPVVKLYGLKEDGGKITCYINGFRPYFYAGVDQDLISETTDELQKWGLGVEVVERYHPVGYQSRPSKMLKITTSDPKEIRELRARVMVLPGISSIYEADVLYRNRFLVDHGLGGMSWAELPGQDCHSDEVLPIQCDSVAPLRYMTVDIECVPGEGIEGFPTPETSPVVLISMAFDPPYKGKNNLVLVCQEMAQEPSDVTCFFSEKEMLYHFYETIRDYNPDILAGYNINDFDIPYLDKRSRMLHVPPEVGRDSSKWRLMQFAERKNVSIIGRVVTDLLPIIRNNPAYNLKQYTLANVAHELINQEKLDMDFRRMIAAWHTGGEALNEFIKYARQDAVLVLNLLRELKLLDKYIALSQASGAMLQDVVNGGQSGMIEALLLRRFRAFNRVMSTRPDGSVIDERFDANEDLQGGHVLDPQKGLQECVLILDYKSLYPTIMIAHNLCYSTVIRDEIPDCELIRSPVGGAFVPPEVQQGIVPQILAELLDQRIATKKAMKAAKDEAERERLDAKQYAMKILLNSFYGYSGYARARLYCLDVASAVTSFGRENIQKTVSLIQRVGSVWVTPERVNLYKPMGRKYQMAVVYGDTDSLFIQLGSSKPIDPDLAERIGQRIAAEATLHLPEPMELVFEAYAKRALFLAKKRYAMWRFERAGGVWQDKIKVKGMETVRKDWCELTTSTQKKCLELILKEGNIDASVELVREVIHRLQSFKIDQDGDFVPQLVVTKKLTKSPSQYKNRQPHIQLLQRMRIRGQQVPGIGDRIPYLIIRAPKKVQFVDRAEDPTWARTHRLPIDSQYYIEKQVLPPMERIFAPLGIPRVALIGGGAQKDIFSFQ